MNVLQEGMTKEEREGRLLRSVVRIVDRGRRVVGTGFFVKSDLIVTCAHVVREALQEQGAALQLEGEEEVEIQPFAEMPEGQDFVVAAVEAEYLRGENAEDVAFLRLSSPLSAGIQPLVLATSQGLEGHDLRGFAFPKAGPKGLFMTATVVGPLDDPGTGRRLQLRSTNVSPGCSGGPLWDKRGRVVGMAVSIVDQEARTGRHGDTAKAIAAEVLVDVCPELLIEHLEHRLETADDRDKAHGRNSILVERAGLDTFRDQVRGTSLPHICTGTSTPLKDLQVLSAKLLLAERPPSLISLFPGAPPNAQKALDVLSESPRFVSTISEQPQQRLGIAHLVRHERPHHFIVAPPGSGKTHALWHAAMAKHAAQTNIPMYFALGGVQSWAALIDELESIVGYRGIEKVLRDPRACVYIDGWTGFQNMPLREQQRMLKSLRGSRIIANGRQGADTATGFLLWQLEPLPEIVVQRALSTAFPNFIPPPGEIYDLLRLPLALSLYILLGGSQTSRGELLSRLHTKIAPDVPTSVRDALAP